MLGTDKIKLCPLLGAAFSVGENSILPSVVSPVELIIPDEDQPEQYLGSFVVGNVIYNSSPLY